MDWKYKIPLETMIWVTGIVLVGLPDPTIETTWTLCIFDWTGLFEWFGLSCPGCGLGHAVGYLFRGEFALSLQTHPLGIPVVGVLLGRVLGLLYETKSNIRYTVR